MGISAKDITRLLSGQDFNEQVDYTPYDFAKIVVQLGTPPLPVINLDYVSARRINPTRKRFQCLSGRGVFVSNVNTAGVIEFGVLNGSLSQGLIEVMQQPDIPYPIILSDLTTGGTASVIASQCQLIDTPEWKREAVPGLTVYTFESLNVLVNQGIRLPLVVS